MPYVQAGARIAAWLRAAMASSLHAARWAHIGSITLSLKWLALFLGSIRSPPYVLKERLSACSIRSIASSRPMSLSPHILSA